MHVQNLQLNICCNGNTCCMFKIRDDAGGKADCFAWFHMAAVLWWECESSGLTLKLQREKLNLLVHFELIGTRKLILPRIQKNLMGNQNVDVLMCSKGYSFQVRRMLM